MFYPRCLLSTEFLRNQGEVSAAAAALERPTHTHAIRRRSHLYPGLPPLPHFVDASSVGAVGCGAAALGPGSEAPGGEEAARPARDPVRGGGQPRGCVDPARPGPARPWTETGQGIVHALTDLSTAGMTSGNGNSASSITSTAPKNGGTLISAGGESQEVCTGVLA